MKRFTAKILSASLVFLGLFSAGQVFAMDFMGHDLFGSKSCGIARNKKDNKVKREIERMSKLDDVAIIAEAKADLAAGQKCDAIHTLTYVMDRWPIVSVTVDEHGQRKTTIVQKEPAYYIDVYLQVVTLLMEEGNHYDAAALLKNFMVRFPNFIYSDYVLFTLGDTYYQRIPADARLDITAARKAQAQYSMLIATYKDSSYRPIAIERLKFINLWMNRQEAAIIRDRFLAGRYYPALVRAKAMYDRFKKYENTFTSDDMAQNFYYSCRAWMRIHSLPRVSVPDESMRRGALESSEAALDALRRFFPNSEWRTRAEGLCGLKGEDPRVPPEQGTWYKRPAPLPPPPDVNPMPSVPVAMLKGELRSEPYPDMVRTPPPPRRPVPGAEPAPPPPPSPTPPAPAAPPAAPAAPETPKPEGSSS